MKAFSDFKEPKNGDIILVKDKKVLNRFWIFTFSTFLALFITIIPIIFISDKFNFNFKEGYYILLPLIVFSYLLSFFIEMNFSMKNEEINKVKYFNTYFELEIGKIDLRISYSEISFFSLENKNEGIVKIYFNKNSQLFRKFKNLGSNELILVNNDFVKSVNNVDLLNFLHMQINIYNVENNIPNDYINIKYSYL